MAPHLRQAWLGHKHIERLESSLQTITSLWDRIDHAVFVVNPQRCIKFANRAG